MDEQLRRERATVTELSAQVDNQLVLIESQAGRLRDLQERLASMQSQLNRIPEVERSLQQTKDEIAALLHSFVLDRRKEEKELQEARTVERESDMRALANLAKELERIPPLEQRLEVQDAEDKRLRETILRLREPVDEQQKEAARLSEQISVLDSRVQRANEASEQLRARMPEVGKALEEHTARIASVEQWAERGSQLSAEMQEFRAEVESSQSQFLEMERSSERQRQQQMAEWGRRMENLSHQIQTWAGQMAYYAEQHEKDRHVVREMQEVSKQIRQESQLIKQSQRIAEEQQRRELREWQAENDKRWSRHLELWQVRLEEQSKLDLAQTDRLAQLEAWHLEHAESLRKLGDTAEENKKQAHSEVIRLHEVIIQGIDRLASATRFFEEIILLPSGQGGGKTGMETVRDEES
jgi:hypothetical protein